jgi:16S rRNA (adenine1518-N6/adenine1519-N6)-dimethyltransferase
MVQAEVADRLVLRRAAARYGVRRVKAAWYADVRRAGAIGRTVFWPAPTSTRDSSPSPAASRRPATGWRPSPPSTAAFAQRPQDAAGGARRMGRLPGRRRGAPAGRRHRPRSRGEVLSVEDFARLAATDRP